MLSNQLENFLDNLPYRAVFYDQNRQLIYSNGRADGSFFPSQDDPILADWIWQDLQNSPDGSLHFQIPNDSFNQIFMQSFQLLFDDQKQCQGVYAYVQDMRPLLGTYLKESGQAIVGWSDTTSGASIKGEIFDEL